MQRVPVVDGVHALISELWQAYVWDTGEGLVLIDTGILGAHSEIELAIHSLGYDFSEVREVLITHSHNDHRGSLKALQAGPSVSSIAHTDDASVIRGLQTEVPPNLTEEERPFAEAVIPRVPIAPAAVVSREVADGDVTLGGGVIVHVPGHTPGSIALHLPARGLLFTGDTIAAVNGRPILGPFNIDREQAKASVRKLANLEFETACFGHAQPLVGGAGAAMRKLAERL